MTSSHPVSETKNFFYNEKNYNHFNTNNEYKY